MILICYDGSTDARAAIEQAAIMLRGQQATVLTVWQPIVEVLAHTGFGLTAGLGDVEKVDEANQDSARKRAEEGARLAREAGFVADSQVVREELSTALAILGEADRLDADAIVLGSRGLTGLRSALLGSVSHAVIQHADRAILVVPSPEVASQRARRRTAPD